MRAVAYILALTTLVSTAARAQTDQGIDTAPQVVDSIVATADTQAAATADTLTTDELSLLAADKKGGQRRPKRDWSTWRPNAKRAMWLAVVLPGAGQIYNRKYWKLPIVYGGFLGCIYAYRWNNQMYHDYSQAYMDIMDDNPDTESYNSFLHLGATITDSNTTTYQNKFKKRKDLYRKWRDLSVFALIGVYALSVIDAYVDASLSEFDISDDLSLQVAPTVLNDKTSANPLKSAAMGLQCAISF